MRDSTTFFFQKRQQPTTHAESLETFLSHRIVFFTDASILPPFNNFLDRSLIFFPSSPNWLFCATVIFGWTRTSNLDKEHKNGTSELAEMSPIHSPPSLSSEISHSSIIENEKKTAETNKKEKGRGGEKGSSWLPTGFCTLRPLIFPVPLSFLPSIPPS